MLAEATASDDGPPPPPGYCAPPGGPVTSPVKKKPLVHDILDGDVVALYDMTRQLYWTCEEESTGIGGCAIKLKRHGRTLTEGAQFTAHKVRLKSKQPAFALQSNYNGLWIAPNWRGRMHVNTKSKADAPASMQQTWFSATHKTAKNKGTKVRALCLVRVSFALLVCSASRPSPPLVSSPSLDQRRGSLLRSTRRSLPDRYQVKLSLARIWCHYDGQWLFTHDSHIHRDPRLALCGDAKRTEEATYYKIVHISRGVDTRAHAASVAAQEAELVATT